MMNAEQRRKLYREEAEQRHQESYANRENTGRFRDIFEPTQKSGVSFWKDKEDDHEIYIVPYITGKQDPKLPEGSSAISVDVFVHRGIGVNQDSFICLNKTYGKKCPICDYQAELRESDDSDDKEIKALNASRRSIYNIVVLDTPRDRDKGVQVWTVSQYKFTLPLEELAHKKKGGGYTQYAHIDHGKVISFRRKGTKMNTDYTAFEFKEREAIPDAILDSAVCLDELLHVPTYEEVYNAFWQAKDEKEDGTEARTHREEKADPPAEKPETSSAKSTAVARREEEKDVPAHIPETFTDCPNGAAFGTDFNQYEECRPCEARRDCRARLDAIEEEARKEKEKEAASAAPAKKVLTRRGK